MIGREEHFHLTDEPTRATVDLLVSSLRSDHLRRAVSPKNDAHRARVIRQQAILLSSSEASESDKREAKRQRKEARPDDTRDEGGEG